MRYIAWEKFEKASWYSFTDNYVQNTAWYMPRLSDPSILLPSESPDGMWHLFSHTWVGVEHFISTSGLNWTRRRLLFFRGHSPFIFKEGGMYHLLFECHDRDWGSEKAKDVTKKGSRILLSSSSDLKSWSDPKIILEAEKISLSSYRGGPCRLARPQLICWEGKYRLYFGAGECRMFDSRQKTSCRLMCAESRYLDGPYKINEEALLTIEPDSEYMNLAVGAVRVYPCADAVAAVECAYYYDKERDRSRSVMLLLKSSDGLDFQFAKVMHTQPDEGWSSRAITSCDIKYIEGEDSFYCYYSANSRSGKGIVKLPVREALGLLLGKVRP